MADGGNRVLLRVLGTRDTGERNGERRTLQKELYAMPQTLSPVRQVYLTEGLRLCGLRRTLASGALALPRTAGHLALLLGPFLLPMFLGCWLLQVLVHLLP